MNRQVLDEASAWFVDFRVGDVDAAASARFAEWLRRSPEHIRAYMSIAQTYVELPALSGNPKIDVQQLIDYARSGQNVIPLAPRATAEEGMANGSHSGKLERPRGARPWLRSRALAASLAGTCALVGLFLWSNTQRYHTYSTDFGERRSITLADGSTVDLNARSTVRVAFSKSQRDVQLIEGQALFEVAKDRSRPFIVSTGAVLVRAVGTQFTVYKKKSGTIVTVVEGRVAVQSEANIAADFERRRAHPGHAAATPFGSGGGYPAPTFLSTGEQLTVTDGTIAEPQHANIAAATAWLQHRLIFDGAPLSDVTDDFNRYNARPFIIEDRALKDLLISGVYSSTDPTSLIRFLRDQPGIQVIETDKAVRIARK